MIVKGVFVMRNDEETPHTPYESAPMQTSLGLFLPREPDGSAMPVIVPHVPAQKKPRRKKKRRLSLLFGKED